jgi:hypothetical protein
MGTIRVWGSGERCHRGLGPLQAGPVDRQPMVEGKLRVALGEVGGGVLLQLRSHSRGGGRRDLRNITRGPFDGHRK